MKITDYNQKVNDLKSRHSQETENLRNTYNSNVKNLEDLHETREKNQYDNYQKKRLEDEAAITRQISDYDQKTSREIEEKTRQFSDRLEQERARFSRRHEESLKDYNKKLDILRETFESADRERDLFHEQVRKDADIKYKDSLKNKERAFYKNLNNINEGTRQSFAELNNEHDKEKLGMNLRFTSDKKKLVENATKSRDLASRVHQDELQKLRRNSDSRVDALNANHDITVKNLLDAKNLEKARQADTFSSLTNKLQKRNVEDIKAINQEKKEITEETDRRIASIKLGHAKEIALRDRPKDIADHFNSEAELRKNYDSRIENLKDTIQKNNDFNHKLNEKVAQEQKRAIEVISENNSREKTEMVRDYSKTRAAELSKLKDRFTSYDLQARDKQERLQKTIEENEITARREKMNSLDRQRASYDNEIRHINSTNSELLSAIKEDLAKEQTRVFEKIKRERSAEITALKSDLQHNFALKESSYVKQIESKERKFAQIERGYQEKIDMVKKVAKARFEQMRQMEEDRRVEDRLAVQREMKSQQIEFDKLVTTMRNEFDKRIAEAKSNNDIHLMKMTKRYEDMLRKERLTFSKELSRRQTMMTGELKSMNETHQLDRDNLIKQYEAKLTKLKEANRVANELKNLRDSNPTI